MSKIKFSLFDNLNLHFVLPEGLKVPFSEENWSLLDLIYNTTR